MSVGFQNRFTSSPRRSSRSMRSATTSPRMVDGSSRSNGEPLAPATSQHAKASRSMTSYIAAHRASSRWLPEARPLELAAHGCPKTMPSVLTGRPTRSAGTRCSTSVKQVPHPRPLVAPPVGDAGRAQHREGIRPDGQPVGHLGHRGVEVDDRRLLGDVPLDALHGGRGERRLPGDPLAALDRQRSRRGPDRDCDRHVQGVEVGDVGDPGDAGLAQVRTDPGQGQRGIHRAVGASHPVLVGPQLLAGEDDRHSTCLEARAWNRPRSAIRSS